VDVRVIGKVGGRGHDLVHQKYPGHRLHVRAILRDATQAFIGSQSLRALELDKRREVGIVVTRPSIIKELVETFDADWAQTALGRKAGSRRVLKRTAGASAQA
jgi:phosphatidylserine/phosphatidylglycerophosphate/cardiolipin synthase-like enzyme